MPERSCSRRYWCDFARRFCRSGPPWPIVYQRLGRAGASGHTPRVRRRRAFTALALPAQAGHGSARSTTGRRGFAARTPERPAQRDVKNRAEGGRRRAPRPRPGGRALQVPSPGRRLRPERPAARRGVGAVRRGRRSGLDATLRLRPGAPAASPGPARSASLLKFVIPGFALWWPTWARRSMREPGLAERYDSCARSTPLMSFTAFSESGGWRVLRWPSRPGCATLATACCSAPTSRTSPTPILRHLEALEERPGPGVRPGWVRCLP